MSTRMRGSSVWWPLAAVFGVLTLVFLPLGQALWIVFMPMAATFAILAVRTRDEGESDEDVEDAVDEPR